MVLDWRGDGIFGSLFVDDGLWRLCCAMIPLVEFLFSTFGSLVFVEDV